MLDKHERQALEEIERRLSADDPGLTGRLGRFGRSRGQERVRQVWRVLGATAAVLALTALVLGAVAQFVVAGALAAVLLGLRGWSVRAT